MSDRKRGRPHSSPIRQNIINLLAHLGSAYGYVIHQEYIKLFPKCTRESIYYHLRKGVTLGEFVVDKVQQEKGKFSWGGVVEKIYYKLGPEAKPKDDPRLVELRLK